MKKTVDGLVLRVNPSGDNDRLLSVLTANEGRIFMTAKGARSARSKIASMCRLFTYANFEYYEKNERRWTSGGSVNDSFFGLNSDLEGFSLASYIAQIAEEITGEGVNGADVLRMTLNSLYCIEKKLKPYWQIKAVYELFAVSASGMAPDLSECDICKTEKNSYWLDVMNGRLICDECMEKQTGGLPIAETDRYSTRNILLPMDASAAVSARYVLEAPIERAFAFSLTDEASIENLSRAAETYLVNHLERSFEALEFYKSLKEEF